MISVLPLFVILTDVSYQKVVSVQAVLNVLLTAVQVEFVSYCQQVQVVLPIINASLVLVPVVNVLLINSYSNLYINKLTPLTAC